MRDYTHMVKDRQTSEGERQWLRVLGTLNELQARLYVAQKALEEGRGGISRLSRLTGMSRPTIMKGIGELKGKKALPRADSGRVRGPGGGRKPIELTDPTLLRDLEQLLAETTAGDPMNYLRWTNKSTRVLAEELRRQGHDLSHVTVGRCLRAMGYSLLANAKTLEGRQHPDRDAQFRYINKQVSRFKRTGDPVLSVDTNKKELVGAFANRGRRWRPHGEPEAVQVHDFPTQADGKAIPYGAYDPIRDEGLVNVGITHDTAEFAVESIHRWWRLLGRGAYRRAGRLLICADAGGSNGHRLRAWKVHLQQLSERTGLAITVCHYPPGTSKWNKIEHRLFSFVSMNWRGRPLVSYEAVVNLIGSTRTRSGLKVKAVLDTNLYATGLKVTDQAMKDLRIKPHSFHGEWNYTVRPRTKRKQGQ
jgi:hypothetical protein